MVANNIIFLGNGPPSIWLMGKYRNEILSKIAKKVAAHPSYKNKKNSFINTAWTVKGIHNQRSTFFKAATCDNAFLYSLEDPFHNFWYTENLKNNVIELGYTENGIKLDFWCLMCKNFFKEYDINQLKLKDNFANVFLCYQFKPHVHRQALAFCITTTHLKNKGIVTLGNFNNSKQPILPKYSSILKLSNIYNNDVYNQLGNKNNGSDIIDIYTLGDLDVWNTSFLNVVSETLSPESKYVFVTEKTFKPIMGLRPFLIYGTPRIYKWLKEAKFDIFEDLWNGHDLTICTSNEEYLEKILSIISFYCNYSKSDIINLYNTLLPRLIYNRNRFYEYAIEQQEKINNFELYI